MSEKITVTQNELENLACDISLLTSQALAIQSQISGISEDPDRYKNVKLEYHEKWIALDLAVLLEKQAKILSDKVDDLITGGVNLLKQRHRHLSIVKRLAMYC